MTTWDYEKHERVEMPAEMEAFLHEILSVYKKYGLSLGHEDDHGAFEVWPYDEDNVFWLMHAHKAYTAAEVVK